MADLVVTAAQVARAHDNAEIFNGLAAETITAGQAVYMSSAGTYGIADANVVGKQQARGIALEGAAAGQAFSFIKRGPVAGFTIPQAYDARLFLSDTAGALADTLGWACATYYDRPQEFAGLQQRAMAQDFSWRHNAGQYVDLYRWAVEQRTGVYPA